MKLETVTDELEFCELGSDSACGKKFRVVVVDNAENKTFIGGLADFDDSGRKNVGGNIHLRNARTISKAMGFVDDEISRKQLDEMTHSGVFEPEKMLRIDYPLVKAPNNPFGNYEVYRIVE